MGSWCILRTAARTTLRLASELRSDGFDAWTPVAVIRKRLPRRKDRVDANVPIAPSFVFARSDRLYDLFNLSRRPVKDCPEFSLFRHGGRIPLVSDRALEGLRSEEDRLDKVRIAERRLAMRGKRGEPFVRGETVRMPAGAFAGMDGIVEGSDGRSTLVSFGGFMRVEIDTFILREDVANALQPIAA